jgi:23S rRNA pseudouridine2605 synthase
MSSRPPRYGVARMISKLGLGSRTQAAKWVREGRVSVNDRVVTDPEYPVSRGADRIKLDDREEARARMVVMLNKPRGLVTTSSDEQGRDTVYSCFKDAALPWLAPLGRLDKASEGLLLFSNDPAWGARVTRSSSGLDKTYHVQIDRVPDANLLRSMANCSAQNPPAAYAAVKKMHGSKSCSTKGATGRYAACSVRLKSPCCA